MVLTDKAGTIAAEPLHDAYVPALDGLRAVSISLVILAHAGLERWVPGAFGVTLFFFISGYLITRQLTGKLARTGRIGIGGFYLRRALRLLPASLAYGAASGILFSLAGGRITGAGWFAALFYGANIYDIWAVYRTTLAGVRHPFNILWSLAIEEHFYLVWPAVLRLLWRRRMLLGALFAICGAALLWRLALYDLCRGQGGFLLCGYGDRGAGPAFRRIYFGTDTRCDSILWGAILAVLERRPKNSLVHPRRPGAPLTAAAWALLGASFLPSPMLREVARTSLQGVALLVLLPAWMRGATITARMLSAPLAAGAGRLSYSLYLWHWGAFAIADWMLPGVTAATTLLGVPLAFALAALSYHAIERPMLRLRRRAGSVAPDTEDRG